MTWSIKPNAPSLTILSVSRRLFDHLRPHLRHNVPTPWDHIRLQRWAWQAVCEVRR